MKLGGWGRFGAEDTALTAPRDGSEAAEALTRGPVIARGNGRAYGQSAVGKTTTISTRNLNKMVSFDAKKGELVAEAGVLIGDIIDAFLPRGWFPYVTPGTKFVTLGGAIAADVHGKNHHIEGSFGQYVTWIEVMEADGTVTRCARNKNRKLFEWTIGGMGLTGVILRAAIRLRPVESAWIRQTMVPAANLRDAMRVFEANHDATYSVAWIDCLATGDALGRSLVMLGEHATAGDLDVTRARRPLAIPPKRKLSVPFDMPGFMLNGHTVRAFNKLYYWKGCRAEGESLVDWDSYFYPLDSILGWNRIYGRKGFLQFQCALPLSTARDGLTALLSAISEAGQGSFLAVLKRLGAQDSRFSFPMEGYTLALDFPATTSALALMDWLDGITLDHGGRFYLAKDARMGADTLRRADPRVGEFAEMRGQKGRAETFQSVQSERLKI
ncbi:FAD-linked oxidase [Actibacterium mucosum KCTC 23349]|uniref:FAD-linked oxidase n=1 Tax=Actibacterium mucosum KCTC 23349 TaxID=1454373 RepID=A0A037ZCA6_9RHOB|nr:FAD-binding oxidoreductase [Actibacterium mucosum]KAJ54134.1 FAD-linked oxidase [Actibacterium mucosum KCTC 23349]